MSNTLKYLSSCDVTYDMFVLNHVRSWFSIGWSEMLRGFTGLPGLYGFKYDGLITQVIAIVLVLL
jgi:hypothetical protein